MEACEQLLITTLRPVYNVYLKLLSSGFPLLCHLQIQELFKDLSKTNVHCLKVLNLSTFKDEGNHVS